MVERIALGAVVLIGVLAIFLVAPRYLTDEGGWPDVIGQSEAIAQRWLAKPRWLDIGVGIVAVILLGIGVSIFRGAEFIPAPEAAGWPILVLGFIALYAGTYVNVRRSGLSSAEATLIGTSLVGAVLIVAIGGLLLRL